MVCERSTSVGAMNLLTMSPTKALPEDQRTNFVPKNLRQEHSTTVVAAAQEALVRGFVPRTIRPKPKEKLQSNMKKAMLINSLFKVGRRLTQRSLSPPARPLPAGVPAAVEQHTLRLAQRRSSQRGPAALAPAHCRRVPRRLARRWEGAGAPCSRAPTSHASRRPATRWRAAARPSIWVATTSSRPSCRRCRPRRMPRLMRRK